MTTWKRLLWGLLGLLACVATVGLAQSGVSLPRELPDLWTAESGPTPRKAAPRPRAEVVRERIRAKSEVVGRLLEHKLTLFEAAAWFGFLNENPPECRDDFRKGWPGDSDGEKLCRQVIHWVVLELHSAGSPDRAQLEMERLEEELAAHVLLHGTVKLPRW